MEINIFINLLLLFFLLVGFTIGAVKVTNPFMYDVQP